MARQGWLHYYSTICFINVKNQQFLFAWEKIYFYFDVHSVIAPPHKNLFFILRQANDHEVKCIAALELHVANHAIYHSNLK